MGKIVLDAQLRAKLNGLTESLEVCDESGEVVGQFLPADLYKEMLFAWLDAQIDEEELERIAKEPGGMTLPEVWKMLGRP